MSTLQESSWAHFYISSLLHNKIYWILVRGRKDLALIRQMAFERAKTMFQRCQSATAEMLKFSVFPWLYLWGKGWVGSSYVCRENKWHFVLSFTACEISLVQTENRMLSWEQETQSDNHLKMLINQPRVCPFSVTVFKLCFPLLKQ